MPTSSTVSIWPSTLVSPLFCPSWVSMHPHPIKMPVTTKVYLMYTWGYWGLHTIKFVKSIIHYFPTVRAAFDSIFCRMWKFTLKSMRSTMSELVENLEQDRPSSDWVVRWRVTGWNLRSREAEPEYQWGKQVVGCCQPYESRYWDREDLKLYSYGYYRYYCGYVFKEIWLIFAI